MQTDQQHLLQNTKLLPIASFFGQNVDFQPSKICPRNFIIFDRTDNRSQIMYHPAADLGFGYPGLNNGTAYIENNMLLRNDVSAPKEVHSVMKEDLADIDLLLSFEEGDEDEECEDEECEEEEEVSTARTHGNDASDTADSCSSKPKLSRLSLSTFSLKSSGSSERKREKMRKMVNALRRIVRGGNQLNTVAVINLK